MRSRWPFSANTEQHSPVEMRFIDMFMTALGALVFLTVVLIFLLPKAAQEEVQREGTVLKQDYDTLANRVEELRRENGQLSKRLQEQTTNFPSGMTTGRFTKEILKAWMAVVLMKDGCPFGEPELYVRFEGELVDWETGEGTGKFQSVFDAAAPKPKDILVGQTYFDLGTERQNAPLRRSANVSELKERGLEAEVFLGMGGAGREFSVYVGAEYPVALLGNNCRVRPVFLTYDYVSVGAEVALTPEHPFAWLNQYEPGKSIDPTPRTDAKFRAALNAFSVLQGIRLCRLRKICGTEDAHLYSAHGVEAAELRSGVGDFERIAHKAFGWAEQTGGAATSADECEKRCREVSTCSRYTYTEESKAQGAANWCRLISEIDLLDSVVAQSGIRRELR